MSQPQQLTPDDDQHQWHVVLEAPCGRCGGQLVESQHAKCTVCGALHHEHCTIAQNAFAMRCVNCGSNPLAYDCEWYATQPAISAAAATAANRRWDLIVAASALAGMIGCGWIRKSLHGPRYEQLVSNSILVVIGAVIAVIVGLVLARSRRTRIVNRGLPEARQLVHDEKFSSALALLSRLLDCSDRIRADTAKRYQQWQAARLEMIDLITRCSVGLASPVSADELKSAIRSKKFDHSLGATADLEADRLFRWKINWILHAAATQDEATQASSEGGSPRSE